jgi:PAS domain S-box-containing protein
MSKKPTYEELEQRVKELEEQIFKRKQAEEALRESEKKYQDLYDNAPDMFCSVDSTTGTILQCNQTLANNLRYTKEEIVGRPVFDLYAPNSVEYAKSTVFPLFVKTGSIKGEELQLQRKDGITVDVSLNVSAVRDEKGKILRSRSVWRDITKRKQVEKERERLIRDLKEALKEIKTLRGILPLCSFCKKVRDDRGYWEQVDVYIHKHSQADISHSVCPECAKEHYPDLDIYEV